MHSGVWSHFWRCILRAGPLATHGAPCCLDEDRLALLACGGYGFGIVAQARRYLALSTVISRVKTGAILLSDRDLDFKPLVVFRQLTFWTRNSIGHFFQLEPITHLLLFGSEAALPPAHARGVSSGRSPPQGGLLSLVLRVISRGGGRCAGDDDAHPVALAALVLVEVDAARRSPGLGENHELRHECAGGGGAALVSLSLSAWE